MQGNVSQMRSTNVDTSTELEHGTVPSTKSANAITQEKCPTTETALILPAQSVGLRERIGKGICRSMDSLNKAADKLTSSMEKSEDYGEIIGMAETLAKTISAQAQLVAAVRGVVEKNEG